MDTRHVTSWDQLLETLKEIQHKYAKFRFEGYEQSNLILYRGLSDSSWELSTTLERESNRVWTIRSYYEKIFYCAREIESLSGNSWHLGEAQDLDKELSVSNADFLVGLPHYDYWAYLRHHGFPSPLLDWTKSPYIALFFALCDQSIANEAALFTYIESTEGSRGGVIGAPMITVLYPYVRTHKRHFLQQSHYTIATQEASDGGRLRTFVPHERVFAQGSKHQDLLIKIVFPRNLRLDILSILESYNINFYSLFQSEDALVKYIALKELELPT